MSDVHGMESATRLRNVRRARGLTQQRLAGMAGIARQTVSAIEAGRVDPSLRNALALARALELTAEELFGAVCSTPSLVVRPVAPLGSVGARVALAPIGDGFVALPLRGDAVSQTGFLPANGLVGGDVNAGGESQVEPIGPVRPTLVAAGCDPVLPLLRGPLGLLDPPVAFVWWPCPSRVSLGLAADGRVHVAGTHLRRGRR
jgi:putative transcriptional regulator